MHLASLDLNLLRVFDVLLEERSVTRAGTRLGLTPSAVSHALSRLRYHLGDDLFQRDRQGMQPTRKALEIGPSLHAALGQLQSALTPTDFEPAVSDRRFSVVAGAYACAVLMPAVVAELQAKAPGVLLQITENPPDLIEQLDSAQVDFVVSVFDSAPERFARERLMTEALAWVVRAGHPLCERRMATLDDLVGVPHVVVATRREAVERQTISLRSSWEDFGAFESELAKRGLRRRVGVVAPDTFSAMTIVARSEMAALIPRRLALLSVQSGRLALIEPPYETAPVNVSLLYRKDRLAEPPIAWMRDVINAAAVGI
ncbi:MAG TPA: LysR family transcriptional regulator [Caulobacteraceae bacterium]|nr:LysR family transcriptional regulator [Caulobacteraceae bacterium]